jgi:hypothetical protein
MKILLFSLILMLPLFANAQAHLGLTVEDIKNLYPDNVFMTKYFGNGQKYINTNMQYGEFYYFFDKKTGLSEVCFQAPHNMMTLKSQIEIYNKRYVIVSETSWKAYLEGGIVMKINLEYSNNIKEYRFVYRN